MLSRLQAGVGGAVSYEWISTSSSETVWCRLKRTATIGLIKEINVQMRNLVDDLSLLSSHIEVDFGDFGEPIGMECSIGVSNSTTNLVSDFVFKLICDATNQDICQHMNYSNSNQVCDDDISKLLRFIFSECKSHRRKRNIFSGLDENNIVANIQTNIRNLHILDKNVHEIDEKLAQLYTINKDMEGQNDEKNKNLTLLTANLEMRIAFREMFFQWKENVKLNEETLSDYAATLKSQNNDITTTLSSAVQMLHGVPSCTIESGISRCLKDVSAVTAENGKLLFSMIYENARLINSVKFCCVPTSQGLSEKNGKTLLKTTIDKKVGLLSSGKSFQLVNDTELQFETNFDDLVHRSGCELNFCGETVLLSCSHTSTITNRNNGVQKIDPYDMIELTSDQFPINLNSEVIQFQSLREHFGSVTNSKISNTVENFKHHSPYSLNTIVRKQAVAKITYGRDLISLISQYGPMKKYFYISVAVFGLIVAVVVIWLSVKFRKYLAVCGSWLCELCDWCSCCLSDTDSTNTSEEGVELMERQPTTSDKTTYVREETVGDNPPQYQL